MKQYVVDAFTNKLFKGNQAAVCIVEKWPSEWLMTQIAKENNFSETAFVCQDENSYHVRYFTKAGEIDFCGHASLASAYVLFRFYEKDETTIQLITQVGHLTVKKKGKALEMTFPKYELYPVEVTALMEEAIGAKVVEAYKDRDLLLIVENEAVIDQLQINEEALMKLDGLCVAVSCKSTIYDCVSRVFAPRLGILEDPVTGSTHCMIGPYYANLLGKKELIAYQASERSGILKICVEEDCVRILAEAVLFSMGDLLEEELWDSMKN